MYKIILLICLALFSTGSQSKAGTAPPNDSAKSLSGNSLHQNYPNPFSDLTLIEFSIENDNTVELIVTDEDGKKIETLAEGEVEKGDHFVFFKTPANFLRGNYICVMNVFSDNGSKLIYTEKIKMLCVYGEEIVFKK